MPRIPLDRTRLRILAWLEEPDVAGRGLTADDVAARLGVPRPAAVTHLRLLTALGLLRAVPCDGCPHYRRDELRISDVAQMFEKGW
ncbi:helix-turn-helix domain-containing protein [Streptomyces griseoflavus]|uniref:helix-turn-helix domain-containing protein n=1 Tax=Streptomyces griseoflavus TaxID=35619 RepID=UPI00059373F9|nr:helix-turn-helix domain-containing protein [Streptomyces griseoflavus]